MLDTLFSMTPVVSLLIFLLGIVLLGFIPYLSGYWFFGRAADVKTRELATLLFRAVAMLLGLILSMNYANVRSEYIKIQDSVELEAKEVGELLSDFMRFGSDDAIQLQDKLLTYLEVVINEEWPQLAKGSLSQKAQELFYEVEDGILAINTESQYQQNLKTRLLKDIDEISDHRSARFYAGNLRLGWFIVVVMSGYLMSTLLLCVNPVRLTSLIFISCYSSFIGLLLYSIVDLHQPYRGLTQVSVNPFLAVYKPLSSLPVQSLPD